MTPEQDGALQDREAAENRVISTCKSTKMYF